MTGDWRTARLDVAVFQNVIKDRITSVVTSSSGGVIVSQMQNNPGDIVVRGLEYQANLDVIKTFAIDTDRWRWSVFSNGYYNFKMTDKGAVAATASTQATRINQYEASLGTKFGQRGTGQPWTEWNFQVNSLIRGPMWYNTEESLAAAYFPGQARNTTVYKKNAFWVWNMRGEIETIKGVKLFGAVRNLFDRNQHPIFLALASTLRCQSGQSKWLMRQFHSGA